MQGLCQIGDSRTTGGRITASVLRRSNFAKGEHYADFARRRGLGPSAQQPRATTRRACPARHLQELGTHDGDHSPLFDETPHVFPRVLIQRAHRKGFHGGSNEKDAPGRASRAACAASPCFLMDIPGSVCRTGRAGATGRVGPYRLSAVRTGAVYWPRPGPPVPPRAAPCGHGGRARCGSPAAYSPGFRSAPRQCLDGP
jgi:hypothetical protein